MVHIFSRVVETVVPPTQTRRQSEQTPRPILLREDPLGRVFAWGRVKKKQHQHNQIEAKKHKRPKSLRWRGELSEKIHKKGNVQENEEPATGFDAEEAKGADTEKGDDGVVVGFDGFEVNFGMESEEEIQEELRRDNQEGDFGGLDGNRVGNQERVQAHQPQKREQVSALNVGSIFNVFKGVQQDVKLRLTHLLVN